ncbi:hypothetical protein [Actinoplanes flavus]|uniref:Transposase n=1 Tax=Actinoplanes flavus TaxID=2820290 RepID=A0ABS3UD68_9ACTN|nr:hypothetical protein [Actinoplanes flavus]MBO3736724.1 hypothetical protein [Actinoplanes flavus]
MFLQLKAVMISNAVGKTDGRIIADSPASPSLHTLRSRLQRWEHAGRPTPESFTRILVPHDGPGLAGWDLRVSHGTVTTRAGNLEPNR